MATPHFTSILNQISSESLRVLSAEIPLHTYIPLDLSVTNVELQNIDVSSSKHLGQYINTVINANNAHVAFGGYHEIRNIYQRSSYFNQQHTENERNIHLGVDLWIEAGSPVFAPLDGVVHSFKNNQNYGDYGPTIILKHVIDAVEFYTLYGHLSLESIQDLEVGHYFQQNEAIATLGEASVNGDYPPHLHFQIIKDLQGNVGDYPGVCSRQDLEFYLENCPDPNLLLNLKP